MWMPICELSMVDPDNSLYPALLYHNFKLQPKDWDILYTFEWQATFFDIKKKLNKTAALTSSTIWTQTGNKYDGQT